MKTFLNAVFLLISFHYATGQERTDGARQKSIIEEAGGYHVEMVQGKDELRFSLVESKEDWSLIYDAIYVEFQFTNKPDLKAFLIKNNSGYYTASYPNSPPFVSCRITYVVNGKEIAATFSNLNAKGRKKHGQGHGH